MGATGYQVKFYADVSRIAKALERIAAVLEAQHPPGAQSVPAAEGER
jgi:hypothetical protein